VLAFSRERWTLRSSATLGLVASAFLASAMPCFADDVNLEGSDLGEHWLNSERTIDELKGHVVLWENFGDDSPSRMAFGSLSRMQEKYSLAGLIVIGNDSDENAKRDVVCSLCRALRVNYTIVNRGHVAGDKGGSNAPYAWLFGADGKLVKEGNPQVIVRDIDGAIQKSSHWITRGRTLKTAVNHIGDGLKAGKRFSWALQECEVALKKGKDAEKEEAQFLKDQILAEAERRLKEAKTTEAEDPARALALYGEVSAGWDKTDAAARADSRLKELKADKAFQEELKLEKETLEIEDLCSTLRPARDGGYDLQSPQNAPTVKQITGAAKSLKEKHGDSGVVKRCLDTLASYGITIP
jgi:hypothetical protein